MEKLPTDLFILIAVYLQPEDIISALSTCKSVKRHDCKLLWFIWLKQYAKYNPLVWNNPFFSQPISDNISVWRLKTTARLFAKFESSPAEGHIMNLIRDDEHLLNSELLGGGGVISDTNSYPMYIISQRFPCYDTAAMLNCKVSEKHMHEYVYSRFGRGLQYSSYFSSINSNNTKDSHINFLKKISDYTRNNRLTFEPIVSLPANYYLPTENESKNLTPYVTGPPYTMWNISFNLGTSNPVTEVTESDVKSEDNLQFKDYQIYTSFNYFDTFECGQDVHKLDDPNMPIYDANDCLNEYFAEVLNSDD